VDKIYYFFNVFSNFGENNIFSLDSHDIFPEKQIVFLQQRKKESVGKYPPSTYGSFYFSLRKKLEGSVFFPDYSQ
jgi:hypothetical protein